MQGWFKLDKLENSAKRDKMATGYHINSNLNPTNDQ